MGPGLRITAFKCAWDGKARGSRIEQEGWEERRKLHTEGGPPGWAPLCFVVRQADGPAPCEADKKQFLRGLLRAWYWSRFSEVLQVEQMFVH